MAGGNKASFTNKDTGTVFHVQFNPKEFKLDASADWKDSDEFQQEKPLLTFDRGKPSTVALELTFDTTDSGANVHDTWVKPLQSFLSVNVEKDEDGKKIKRPPFLIFTWDKFIYHCVAEKIGVQFLMFSAGGTPLRAKVSLGLKESVLEVIQSSANAPVMLSAMNSMMQGSGKDKTYVIKDGETLSQVAKKTNSDPKLIAAANNIKDPMNPPPGPVVIPTNAIAAAIFEHLNKSEALAAWGDFKPNLNPDSASSDDWSIEKGEFVFELTAEKEINFSSYEGEAVEANEYSQGDSALADNWDIGANEGVEHEYGEENEAQFSSAYGGNVEKNEYTQGESASSDGWDTSENEGIEHEYGEENEAQFSSAYGGNVEKNEYSQGESASSDGWDTSKNDISHAAAKEEKMEGAAANTGKGAHSSDASAGGAAGGKGAHSSDASAGGAAGGKGEHSSDSSAGGAAGGKGAHSSDSGAGGASGGKGAHSSDSGAGGAGGASSKGDAAASQASTNAAAQGDAAASGAGSKPAGAGQAAADKAAGDAAGKSADTAASDAKSGAAASGGSSVPNAPRGGGNNAATGAVAEKAGGTANAASAPPPETLKGNPAVERSVTGRQVNPGDSSLTNAQRDVSKVVAEAETAAKEVDKAIDSPQNQMADIQYQAEQIAAKAEMHADRITGKDKEATNKK